MQYAREADVTKKDNIYRSFVDEDTLATNTTAETPSSCHAILEEMSAHTTNGNVKHINGNSQSDIDLKMAIVFDFMQEVLNHPETYFYAGVPVIVNQAVVGSLCMIGTRKPEIWNESEGVSYLEQMSSRASKALEKQVEVLSLFLLLLLSILLKLVMLLTSLSFLS